MRLHVVDELIRDHLDNPIRLRGANLKGINDDEARVLAKDLKMNFARLRISFESPNRDDGDPSGFSKAYREEVDGWVRSLSGQGVWILLEMRGNDELTNDPSLYDPTSPEYQLYERAWSYLACRYKSADLIAGYGLLAEPSASRADKEPVDTLTTFQRALMATITDTIGDHTTPFFVGADFNYDTMQYRYDDYYERLAGFRGRLVFEVNGLVPKPWIQDGSVPDGVPREAGAYPQLPAPTDFDFLLTPAPGEKLEAPRDLELIFSKRSEEPENFPKLLNPDFLRWYMHWAVDFSGRHRVPMVVDQFGASTAAAGQLTFEKDFIQVFEEKNLHWSRWSFNAGSPDRFITGNPAVEDFYRGLAAP
jgi:hypothetical protein